MKKEDIGKAMRKAARLIPGILDNPRKIQYEGYDQTE